MTQEQRKNKPASPKLFAEDGKPLKVLSTSLGIALLANAVFSTGAMATSGTAGSSDEQPKLVSWSTEDVKKYYDAKVDWSLPITPESLAVKQEEGEGAGSGSGDTTVIHHYESGFGWDDLLLYHLLFNAGSSYSSKGWYSKRPAYYTKSYYSKSKQSYQPKTYTSDMFQNKQVAGTSVRPKTSTTTGSVTRRSTSSQPGGIGGKSSGISSSGTSGTSGSKSSSVSSSGSSKSSSTSSGRSSGFGG
ncbi:hypothetical protein M6D81_18115 [Paenibacillus sp. J5C_2022]|uniref:hypothetical protein n=1 Tax=Paenibacillus sp. J5C2022 TaxID=2977129 RepID=UPI0021D352BD|nr:hypothetical protein [Paenibacillus sp. J5C2022]MCU6710611.1 hypothetical protein [Paenibacillus sp. J5C2022]